MQKQLSEQEKQILTFKAISAISEHLRHHISYNMIMEDAAQGEAAIIQLMQVAGTDSCDSKAITGFIIDALDAFKLLKPFAQLEGQAPYERILG